MKKLFTPNRLRYIFFWLMTLSLIGGPIWVLSDNYNLFKFREYTMFKVGLTGAIIITVVVIYFIKHIKAWIKNWKPSVGKSILDIWIHIMPYVLVAGAIELFKRRIDEIQSQYYLILWFIIAGFVFKQFHDYYRDYTIKLAEFTKLNEVVNK